VFLIAGLGNPGKKYSQTRHNIGFKILNQWSEMLGAPMKGRRFQSRNAMAHVQGKAIILLRPITYMNRSGQAIKGCLDYYRLHLDQILVVHDDLDLPTGKIKLVPKGGAAGHKGVRSIIDHIGTDQFSRLKIGIGRPQYDEDVEDYVLASFYPDEKEIMEKTVPKAIKACELVITEGIERAMNHVNSRDFLEGNRPY
jgi:PTH1 family peptidyl-tRNA hydrolase